jgi:hypothetical protein
VSFLSRAEFIERALFVVAISQVVATDDCSDFDGAP